MPCGDPLPLRRVALGHARVHPVRPAESEERMTLPVCWCGDPATYALDASHPAGVSPAELVTVWERDDAAPVLVAARCRGHAGPFAVEVTTGQLVPVQLVPIDTGPCCDCGDAWQPCGCWCHT